MDQSFYNALENKALLQVAEETVKARQLLVDQVQALTTAKLKSDVDLAFAKVDMARANLLLWMRRTITKLRCPRVGNSRISGPAGFCSHGAWGVVTPPAPDALR